MDEEKDLLEGFNAGYIIEKHRPYLAQQLVKSVEGVELPFAEGFIAGTEEYAKERSRNKIIERMKRGFKPPTPPSKTKGKDKGIDMER
jgi:hypothetical protein